MRFGTSDKSMSDGEKRLLILKESLCEYVRDELRRIAEDIYAKGYDLTNFPGLYKILFEGRPIMARINYSTGEIEFSDSKAWKSIIGRGAPDSEAVEIKELKNLLLYKPILDMISGKTAQLPDCYDAEGEVLDALGKKAILPADVISDRTIVDEVELSPEDIETITNILEQEDFPGILEEYSEKVMTKYIEESTGTQSTPGR